MRINLSVKIIGSVLLLSSIFFSILAYSQINTQENIYHQTSIDRAKAIAYALDTNIKNINDLNSSELIKSIQKYIWLNSDILEISVNKFEDNKMVMIVNSNLNAANTTPNATNIDSYLQNKLIDNIFSINGHRVLRVITPIHLSGKNYGTYQIDITLENMDKLISASLVRTVVTYSITFTLFIVFLYTLLRLIVITPLHKLNQGLTAVSLGNFNYTLNINSRDELEDLVNSFNIMRVDLQKSHASLTAKREELEREVAQRTQELEETKNKLETINVDLETKVSQRTLELQKVKDSLEIEVSKRTDELQKRVADMERMNKLMVGRENKMIELKKEIEQLRIQLEAISKTPNTISST
jgi:HAMP domain-containing protein